MENLQLLLEWIIFNKYIRMKEGKKMKAIQAIKFHIDITNKNPATPKHRQAKDISLKRMKYCLKKISVHNKEIMTPEATISYNDSTYFDCTFNLSNLSPMVHSNNKDRSMHSSNLFRTDRTLQSRKKDGEINPQNKATIKAKSSMKYLSGQIFGNVDTTSRKQLKLKTYKEIRPKSSMGDGKRKQSSKINPYTQEQYLYFRKKDKEKIKKQMEELSKKEMAMSIMAHCKVLQKQIQTDKRKQPSSQSADNTLTPRKLVRPQTCRSSKKKRENIIVIQPWDDTTASNFDPFDNEPI